MQPVISNQFSAISKPSNQVPWTTDNVPSHQKEISMTSRIFTKSILTLAVAFLLLAISAHSATIYSYTQNAGGARDWEDDANWSGSWPTPVAGDTIQANLTMTAATFLNLGADRTFEAWTSNFQGFGPTDFTINSGYTINLVPDVPGETPTITHNGKGSVTMQNLLAGTDGLKKAGSQTLVLDNASNSFSGGIELAAGTLKFTSDAALGDASNDITVSGTSTLSAPTNNTTVGRDVAISNGATLLYTDKNTFTISGAVTGQGGMQVSASGFGNQDFNLSNTANTFTGSLKLGQGDTGVVFTTNSFADSTNPFEMQIGSKGDTKFVYGSGAVAPLVLDNRQVILSGTQTKNHVIENANTDPNNTITITKDLSITSTVARKLVLQGVNTGSNTISGIIPDGASGGVTSLEKNGTGTWVLAGANSYTGATTVNDGLLVFVNTSARPSGSTVTVQATGSVGLGVGGAGGYTVADVDALYAGTLTGFSLNSSSGIAIDTTGDFPYSTAITGSRDLTKLGGKTLTLSGNNTYTGTTTVTEGTVIIDTGAVTSGQGSYTVGSGAALGGNGEIGLADNKTVTFGDGALFYFDENSTLTVSGTNVTVDVTELSIADILNLDASTPVGPYTLIEAGTGSVTITVTNSNWGIDNAALLGGKKYAYFSAGSLQLNVFEIPEPSTAILAGLGLMGVCFRRRRK